MSWIARVGIVRSKNQTAPPQGEFGKNVSELSWRMVLDGWWIFYHLNTLWHSAYNSLGGDECWHFLTFLFFVLFIAGSCEPSAWTRRSSSGILSRYSDVGDVDMRMPPRPFSQKRACEVLGLSDLVTGLHVSLPCCCAYGALMVHLWCTCGALMVLLFWFLCTFLVIQIRSLSWHGQRFPCHMHEQKDPAQMISWRAMRMKRNISSRMSYLLFLKLEQCSLTGQPTM